jgi:hypothetical protein
MIRQKKKKFPEKSSITGANVYRSRLVKNIALLTLTRKLCNVTKIVTQMTSRVDSSHDDDAIIFLYLVSIYFIM